MKIPELPNKMLSANELLAIPGMESLFTRFNSDLLYLGESPKTNAEALLVSLVKWALTIKYGMRDNGGEFSCGLCMMYINDECFDCPIYAITGFDYCHDTPFQDWANANNDSTRDRYAQEEYDFLWSLAEGVRQ